MLLTRHGIAPIIEACRQRLAGRIVVQPGDRRLDVAGQPGALEQALGIDHQVITTFAQARLEASPLAAAQGIDRMFAPATNRHRNHLRHRWMPGRDLGEALLHDPVELDARQRTLRIGQRWQGMHDIAQRRGLDQQDLQSAHLN